ncbi:MAG TPA: imelysin family protein, partial [Arenibacter sp.]|nr:imelysin family protein [Arenibacter sp.]
MDKKILHVVLGMLFILTGCSSNQNDDIKPENGFDRKAMLENLADHIIIPGYDSFKQRFDVMQTTSEDFLNAPSLIGLQEFRSAWKEAYIEWQKVELFDVGPAQEATLRTHFNIYPFNVAEAEANITLGIYNLDEVRQIATQGFPAIDYFLNGTGADDAAILAWFNDPAMTTNRKKYVRDVVGKMNEKLQAVVNEWAGSYRSTFINNAGTDAASSTGKLVNAYILHYERFVRSGKVGIPAGIIGSSLIDPAPEKVEAFYQRDLSKELALTAQQAVLDFYRGKSFNSTSTGPSFKSYFTALGVTGSDGRLLA